jgi:hypothetical protein
VVIELNEREQDILLFAWEAGRSFGHTELVDALEEARAIPVETAVPRTWDERVAERHRELDECAARVRDDLRRYRQRELERDRANVDAAARYPALTWDDIRWWVSRDVWERIRSEWWDSNAGRWKPGTDDTIKRGG